MKWYSDDKNAIWFPGGLNLRADFDSYQKERSILYTMINSCYREGLDPFHTITAYCVSEMAKLIDMKNHNGYFYGVGRFLYELERYNCVKYLHEPWDIVKFHWIIEVYLAAHSELNLSYFEIASRYPARKVYKVFNPLHETSETNALSKMKFDREDLCGCLINGKYYLYTDEVPEDKRYLLDKFDEAKTRVGVLYLNTTFFHLVDEPNGYLSNWYPSEFSLDGVTFNCVEQYMMWKKAEFFEDHETAEKILNTKDPAVMKNLGRSMKGYIDSKWAAARYNFVHDAVLAKFSQNSDLKEQLLSTSGLFAECAQNDLVWGIGLAMDDNEKIDRTRWRGQNLLGMILEDVYKTLKAEEDQKDVASESHVF